MALNDEIPTLSAAINNKNSILDRAYLETERRLPSFIPAELRLKRNRDPNNVLRKKLKERQNSSLQFPANIGDPEQPFYIQFTRFRYARYRQQDRSTADVISRIRLPLSTAIGQAYGMQIEDFSTSLVFAAGVDTFQDISNSEGLDGFVAAAATGAEKLGSLIAGGAGNAAASVFGVNNDLSNTQGRSLNNKTEAAFTGVNLKDHSYSFKLMPTSRDEAESIENIIKEFKIAMHPQGSATSQHLSYPDEFIITFHSNETSDVLPPIADCFLVNMSIVYNDNAPKFFEDDKPTSTTIELSFKESNILTREDIENGY